MRRAAAALAVAVAIASGASAQDAALGDPIVVHGVEVRGFQRRADARPVPHIQHRDGVRISVTTSAAPPNGGTETREPICGVRARRTELALPAARSERVTLPGGDPLHHLIAPARPAMTYVRVGIPRTVRGRTRWVLVEWAVPTARRAEVGALESAFFSSIRCAE